MKEESQTVNQVFHVMEPKNSLPFKRNTIYPFWIWGMDLLLLFLFTDTLNYHGIYLAYSIQ